MAALFVMVLLASAGLAQAQSVLRGKVLTSDSTSIVAAHVSLHDSAGRLKADALTDSAGVFRFRVANRAQPVTLYLSVVRVGFASIELVPVRIGRREDVSIRVHMAANAIELSPVTVVARRRLRSSVLDDYYDKLEDVQRGVGHVLDRDVMQRYAGLELITALPIVPGVQQGRAILSSGVTLTVPRMSGGCIPMTFLDRVPVPPEELVTMDPADLEGVLVYVGGIELPPDYSRLAAGSECGLILAYRAAHSGQRGAPSLLGIVIILGAYLAVVLTAKW